MTTDKPLKILSIDVTPNLMGQAYAAGSSVTVNFKILNTTESYTTDGFYSYYFGYMNGPDFVQWDIAYEGILTGATIGPGEIKEFSFNYTFPIYEYKPIGSHVPLLERYTYCFKMRCVPTKYVVPMEMWGEESIAFSRVFGVRTLSSGFLLWSFKLDFPAELTCNINQVTGQIVGTVPAGSTRSGRTATFIASENAKVYVGVVEQTSGVTVNDFSSPIQYKVVSEDGNFEKLYTVTISLAPAITGGGAPKLALYNPAGVYPERVKIGSYAKIYCSIGNNSDTSYEADSGAVVYVYYQDPVSLDFVMIPKATISINKDIPKKTYVKGIPRVNYVTFAASWYVTDSIPYGDPHGKNLLIKLVLPGSSSILYFNVDVVYEPVIIKTWCFSEKLMLFQGERSYDTPHYLRLNNDLYAAWDKAEDYGATGLKQLIYHKQDVDLQYDFYSQPGIKTINWSIVFYVNNPISSVIFQSLVIEAGAILGGNIEIESIEYKTSKYVSVQDPFYDDSSDPITGRSYGWENPWQPVWKNDKWYLSIKNAYDEDKVIKNQKLRGMWLRISFRGTAANKLFVRSVITKIAKVFN
jgi:hypothetical protein